MTDPAQDTSGGPSFNQTSGSNTSGSGFSIAPDPQFLKSRITEILTDPKGCWTKIKAEASSEKDIFSRYLIIMAAVPVICQFIRAVIFGYKAPFLDLTIRMPFFSGLVYHVVFYACSLAMIYVGAVIVEKLAPKFEGNADRVTSLKLMAYSYTPGFVAGLSALLPGMALQTLGGLFGLYGLYIFFQGINPMTSVPENKRLGFFGAFIVCMIVTAIILFGVVGRMVYPSFGEPNLGKLPGNVQMDLKELGKQAEKFRDLLPKDGR